MVDVKYSVSKEEWETRQDLAAFYRTIKGKKIISNGVSAMSISDMTNIPRATVIRKCKFLVKTDYLKLNEKRKKTKWKIK